jgi:OmpA-OmpF porin, OOP family
MHTPHTNRFRTLRLPALTAAVAALTWASTAALAQSAQSGPYLGATIGKPDWRADSVGGVSGDTSGSAYKIYGGYRMNPNFALELGAMRLGRLSGPLGEAKASGYSLDAVGLLPLNTQWSALGRLGVGRMKTSAGGVDDTGTAPKFGLGAQYQLNSSTALRGEWERYRLDAFGAKSNVDALSLGAQFSF